MVFLARILRDCNSCDAAFFDTTMLDCFFVTIRHRTGKFYMQGNLG
jgi:hypothetical protein